MRQITFPLYTSARLLLLLYTSARLLLLFIMSNKRKCLTLEDRIKVLDRHDKGESARLIAMSLGCGKTQIQSIIKDKVSIPDSKTTGTNVHPLAALGFLSRIL